MSHVFSDDEINVLYGESMEYQFAAGEPVDDAVRRIAHDQTALALADLRSPEVLGPVGSVHDFRKRCNEVRALVRLVRGSGVGLYGPTNVAYRNAGRALAEYRDAHALLATFDDLIAVNSDRMPEVDLIPIRAELVRRSELGSEALLAADGPLDPLIETLETVQSGIDDWRLSKKGWRAMSDGVNLTYRRGRLAVARAQKKPQPANFRELRRRAKYTRNHLRLLQMAAPSILVPMAANFKALSDSLGDAHDLAVLQAELKKKTKTFGGKKIVRGANRFIDEHRVDLERRSLGLAVRLYQESPNQFADRIGGYWKTWNRLGDEQRVGSIRSAFDVGDDFDSLNVSQLRRLASAHQIQGRSSLRRDDLLATLRVHGVATPGEAPPERALATPANTQASPEENAGSEEV